MLNPRPLRAPGRMKRIAEANHAADAEFVGDHGGHAAAHGFAAKQQPAAVLAGEHRMHGPPVVQ